MPSTYSSPAHSTDRPLLPQLLFFVSVSACSRNEGGGRRDKTKVCCHLQRVPPPGCGLSDCHNETNSHTLSEDKIFWGAAVGELWCRRNEDTKLTKRTVNNKERYNSRDDSCSVAEEHTVQQKQMGDVVISWGTNI